MIKATLLGIALAIAVVTPAAAHLQCWPAYALKRYLEEVRQESMVMTSIGDSGYPVELWRSKDGSTFTIITYRPPNQACLVISGVDTIEIRWLPPIGEPT